MISRRMRELIVEWAVEDQGLSESNVGQTKVVRKACVRRGESTIEIESKLHFDYRRSRSSSARQRYYIAAHFPEGNQPEGNGGSDAEARETDETTVWYGLIMELVRVELVDSTAQLASPADGERNRGESHRIVAIVEWESSAKLDPVTSLAQSIRRRGRVWKGKDASAISIELVDRVIGYFDMEIGNRIQRQYLDTDYETLKLGDPRSHCQLHHI